MDIEPTDSSNSNLDPQYPPDVKTGFDEQCPVCEDKVSGYHYGLLTCESCKGFFKRTVQNNKQYSCIDSRQCVVDKTQRKRCPYCRFQKCLSVGMKLEAVRQDRMRGGRNKFGPMYKRDRAMKQQQLRDRQRIISDCDIGQQCSGGGAAPASPPDIKPDPAMLQASLGLGGFHPSGFSNHTDFSNMAAAMAAAVVGASSMDGGSSASTITTAAASAGSGYSINTGHMATSTAGRGMSGGGEVLSSGGSPLHLDDGSAGALNLHTPQIAHPSPVHPHHPPHPAVPQQNGFLPHSRGSVHHPLPPPPANHVHPHPASMENSYFLPAHPATAFGSQAYLDGRTSPPLTTITPATTTPTTNNSSNGLDMLRGFSVPPLPIERPSLPALLCEIKANLLEEGEMKHKMLSFLNDTLRQLDGLGLAEQLLHVICRMVDQLLFLMVEWARSSPFFREIQVEDQMKMLQNSWNEILILDFVFRQVNKHWGDELLLPNGLRLNFETLNRLGLEDVHAHLRELIKKAQELELDYNEYMCLKFLILLNPDISGLDNREYVEKSQEKVNAALQEYCLNFYPNHRDKFSQILLRLPEIRVISIRMEEFLYHKHLTNQVPDQTLLTEMLHSRRK